jgi:hypothetical protein
MRDRTGSYRVLMRRSEGRRPLGRPRRTWKDNIKLDLQAVEFGDMEWIDLAQTGTGGELF